MKTISFKLVGVSPLMLNNPRTVSPFDAYTKQISNLTSKRRKTEDDQLEICRLKFLASLYQNTKGEYIIPSSHIMQAVKCAAKEIRLGAKVERSFGVMDDGLLKFKDADKTPEQLYEIGIYVDCRAVGIRGAKVLATRAIFPEWSTECTCWYDESQLDRDQIVKLFEVAGLRYHLGTFRAMYGKFKCCLVLCFKEKFGLPKLSFENYDKNVDAYIEAIQLQQFTYMEMVDKLREDLLKNKQCCLRNDWGKGYKIVPSNKQANYGYDQMMSDIKKALKQGSDIINNVRPLPMEEQSKYYDTLAKLAKVRDVFANLK